MQAVEKVSENLCQISPNSSLQKQKNSINLCLRSRLMFCPAAIITPSMLTFNKPR
jgi:hypothetical protein